MSRAIRTLRFTSLMPPRGGRRLVRLSWAVPRLISPLSRLPHSAISLQGTDDHRSLTSQTNTGCSRAASFLQKATSGPKESPLHDRAALSVKLSPMGYGCGSRALPSFLGAFSLLGRVAMKSRAMAKNATPNRILIRLPMIGYAEFNNKPLSASSRCFLMKDKAPRETKPAPKARSPALVDSFSKSRGVFMF